MENHLFIMSGEDAVEAIGHYYEQEADLQKIIADNPHLIIRSQDEDVHNLYLIKREFDIKAPDTSFSADHLFVDDTGVPTIVEVKRSSDTRIRREVVAQVLDYACRASEWSVDNLRHQFKSTNAGKDFCSAVDTDEFWYCVSENLKAEHLRLIFVADTIPDTLRDLILFLDRHLENIDVYGAEVKPFDGNAGGVLLTNFVCADKTNKKAPSAAQQHVGKWSMDNFSEYLNKHQIGNYMPTFREIKACADELGLTCVSGTGPLNPTYYFRLGDFEVFSIAGWNSKRIGYTLTAQFCVKEQEKYFDGLVSIDYLKKELSNIPSREQAMQSRLLRVSPEYVYIEFSALQAKDDLEAFKSIVRVLAERAKSVPAKTHESNE